MRSLIFLIFFFTTSVMAKELEVIDQNRKYKITFEENLFTYKDEATDVTFTKKACNAHIVERINKQISKYLEKPFLEESRPEFLKLKSAGKMYYEPRYGERAVFFLKMPQEIKTLKIEESFNCGKN